MQGGSKSLPNTPREQDGPQHTAHFWSTGSKEASDRQKRPSGARVKLFAEDEKPNEMDVKPQRSVHWDEGIQLGNSPTTYWNVENGTIKSTSNDNGNLPSGGTQYFSRDDFDTRISTTVTTQGSNAQATLMSVNRSQSLDGKSTSGVSSASDNQVSVIRSDNSGAFPNSLPSQSVIQDRILRDGHFTSSPKLDSRTKSTVRDNSQDISLVSSISAPFELRPKAYDDTMISEHSTFVDDSDSGENLNNGTSQRWHQSDGAAQLITMRQCQSTNMTNPAMLPPQPSSLAPSSRTQFSNTVQTAGLQSMTGQTEYKEGLMSTLRPQGQSEEFQPLMDDTMMSKDSVKENRPIPTSTHTRQHLLSTEAHSHSKWVDNALQAHQNKSASQNSGESSNVAIQNLEQVRGHLHNMINMTKEALPDKAAFDQTDEEGHELLGGLIDVKQNESFSSVGSFPILSGKSMTDIESILSFGGGVMHSTANYQPGSTNSSVLLSEIQLSKEQLQRERFRRKHCEKQITELQSKMLELQQQLAVAVSTDRKKETMIEHLDKALAKVVDGWKKKDGEKVEIIHRLEAENNELEQKCNQQHEEILKLNAELNDTKERLSIEVNRANQAEEHVHLLMDQQAKEREEMKNLMEKERLHLSEMEMERNEIQETKEKLLSNYNDLQQSYENDRENWEEKERDYLQKIDEITDNHLKCMDQERTKLEKQDELLTDTQQVLAAAQTEVQNLKMQLDTATREKESLKVEIGLTEARLENSKRKLESDLRSDLERQMTERIEEAHNRQMASEEELRERHRRQMFELNQRHSTEMEEQLQQYQEDIRRKEEKITHQALSFEEKVTEMKIEMDTIKAYVKKLEGQRLEMTNKLQSMMQTHCNEALRLLQIGSSSTARTVNLPLDIIKDGGYNYSTGQNTAVTSTANHSSGTSTEQSLFSFQQNNTNKLTANREESTNTSQSHATRQNASTESSNHSYPYLHNGFTMSTNNPIGTTTMQIVPGQPADQTLQCHVSGNDQHGGQFDIHSAQSKICENNNIVFGASISGGGSQQSEESKNFQNVAQHNNVVQNQDRTRTRQSLQMHYHDQSVSQIHQHQGLSQLYHHQGASGSVPMSVTDAYSLGHSQYGKRNPSFLETLPAEAEAQDQRFRILHGDSKEKYSGHDDFKPLSCDSTMDATGGELVSFQSAYPDNHDISFSRGQVGHETLDVRLSTGTLQDEEQDSSHTSNKSSGHQSARSQNSSNGLDYKSFTEKVYVHEERQTELQHYIKMLLQKSPNSPERQQEVPTNTPADPDHPVQDNEYFQSTTETDGSVTIFSPTRAPETPPKQAFHKSLVGGRQFTNLLGSDVEIGNTGDSRGVLSPQQVGEISRLLGLYRPGPEGSSNITSAGTTPPMPELLTYLKDLKPESNLQDDRVPQEAPTRDVASLSNPAKRNLSSTYNASAPKQVVKDPTTKGSPTSSKGSPRSSKQVSKHQTTKTSVNKPSQVQVRYSGSKGGASSAKTSSTVAAQKKPDRKVVSSKAKQGVWK